MAKASIALINGNISYGGVLIPQKEADTSLSLTNFTYLLTYKEFSGAALNDSMYYISHNLSNLPGSLVLYGDDDVADLGMGNGLIMISRAYPNVLDNIVHIPLSKKVYTDVVIAIIRDDVNKEFSLYFYCLDENLKYSHTISTSGSEAATVFTQSTAKGAPNDVSGGLMLFNPDTAPEPPSYLSELGLSYSSVSESDLDDVIAGTKSFYLDILKRNPANGLVWSITDDLIPEEYNPILPEGTDHLDEEIILYIRPGDIAFKDPHPVDLALPAQNLPPNRNITIPIHDVSKAQIGNVTDVQAYFTPVIDVPLGLYPDLAPTQDLGTIDITSGVVNIDLYVLNDPIVKDGVLTLVKLGNSRANDIYFSGRVALEEIE